MNTRKGHIRHNVTVVILVILNIIAAGVLIFLFITRWRPTSDNLSADIAGLKNDIINMADSEAEEYISDRIKNESNDNIKLNAQIIYIRVLSNQEKYTEAIKYSENIDTGNMTDEQKNEFYGNLVYTYSNMGDYINAIKYEQLMPNPPKGGGA